MANLPVTGERGQYQRLQQSNGLSAVRRLLVYLHLTAIARRWLSGQFEGEWFSNPTQDKLGMEKVTFGERDLSIYDSPHAQTHLISFKQFLSVFR